MSEIFVKSGDTVSVAATNWVAAIGKQTFLYAEKNLNWLGTDNNVDVRDIGKNLDIKYLFKISLCSGSGTVNYGDRINVEALNNRFVQCGGGTCDSGNQSSCRGDDWQIFTIKSTVGNSGPVKIGDSITITQETGGKCSILPADNSKVFCGTTINNNEYLKFFLPNGTDGASAQESQEIYNEGRDELQAKQNPAQKAADDFVKTVKDAPKKFASFFEISDETKIIIAMIVCCLIMCSVLSVLLKLFL